MCRASTWTQSPSRTETVQHSKERAWLQKLFRLHVASQSPDTVYLALRLQAFHSLSHWGALIIASALQADCTTIYSEDLAHGANYDGVTVINPFRAKTTS